MTAEGSLQAGAATAPVTVPQPVAAPLTSAAIFCILEVRPGEENLAPVRALCGDLAALLRAVGFRATDAGLSCVMGLSSGLWDRLAARRPRPAGLHPFRELLSGGRHAPATAGDLLFHIRSSRMDLCFELAAQILARLGGAVAPVDEVHGFRYFDERDLIGFVDGTENPTGQDAIDATVIGAEDPPFAGGSYVIVQKYLHDLARWNALPVEEQERIIGRTKLTNIELDDDVKPSYAHNALTSLTDEPATNRHRPGQHAVRPSQRRGVRHLLHRLRAVPGADRANAGEHVRRPAARQLRPAAGCQPRGDRRAVLRALGRGAGEPRRAAAGRRGAGGRRGRRAAARGAGAVRRITRNRQPQRRD